MPVKKTDRYSSLDPFRNWPSYPPKKGVRSYGTIKQAETAAARFEPGCKYIISADEVDGNVRFYPIFLIEYDSAVPPVPKEIKDRCQRIYDAGHEFFPYAVSPL